MDKNQILNIINRYNLDKSKFCVISGAALVLLGIEKATHDIDICCDKDYCKYLLENYNCEFERVNELREKAYIIDNIINFESSFVPQQIEIINGVRVS